MKSVGFFVFAPFTQRDYNRFGIEILKKNFNVYVLDFNKIFGSDLNNQYEIYKFEGYFSINSLDEFMHFSNKLSLDYAIDFLDISPISFKIRNFLQKQNVSITKVQNGLQPKHTPRNYFVEKIKENLFSKSSWKKIIFKIHKLLYPKSYFYSDEILVGGLSGLNLIAAKFSKTIIPCHSFDYDIYLNLKNQTKIKSEKYLVFIDQYLAFHPDIKFLKLKQIVSPDKYYKSLEFFFKKVEAFYNLKLVVAAHPRSNYHLYPEIFKERKIIKGKTAELIKDCEHVFMHASNALSFAVLFRKPIYFITTDEINNSSFSKMMNVFSGFFSKKYLNIDSFNKKDLIKFLNNPIKRSLYKKYESSYLIHPSSPKKFFWDIYTDYILKKNN